MSKPKKLITVVKISNNSPHYFPPLHPACNASLLVNVNVMDTDYRLPSELNVDAFMICESS
jgi:hypothetical protein